MINRVRLYSLEVNGTPLVVVDMECPAWLPVKPTLDQEWLRMLVATALRRYFKSLYLKEDDTCKSGEAVN